jgi:hypothetical protein
MSDPFDPTSSTPNTETARTYRQLRLMKALIKLDDPGLEQALTLIVERLAEADDGSDLGSAITQNPSLKPVE